MRYELENLDALLLYPDVYEKFLQVGWIYYFKKLQGFNEAEVLEFSQNLVDVYSMVHEVWIPVIEESIVAMTGWPTTRAKWFNMKAHLPDAHRGFIMGNEQVQMKGWGVDVNSLPDPWGKVLEFIKRYITCEGRYQVVYFFYFVLLSHFNIIS